MDYYVSVGELQRRFRTGQSSPVDIVNACLARIDQLNERLNAFVTVLADEAREQARQAAAEIKAGRPRGPLHGIPVGIKDFYDTANIRTTAAFEKFVDRVPRADAASVARLKAAGAIVLGKTNMHRLGMGTTGLESCFGAVRNPWNADYIPGGSSSGSAAAVAVGMCHATLDTDAIGSCRLPAACCGVAGFKPTYGRISTKGILEGEKADEAILWLSHAGITTRSVEDTVIVLDALTELDDGTKAQLRGDQPADRPWRLGIADNVAADEQVAAAFEAAVETVRAAGHETRATRAPVDTPPVGDLRTIEGDRKTIAQRAFAEIDLLLLPTTMTAVPTVRDATANAQALSAAATLFANYFGLPAITVPCGFDRRGLPIGLQIVGKPWADATVLRFAREYQEHSQFAGKHPIP